MQFQEEQIYFNLGMTLEQYRQQKTLKAAELAIQALIEALAMQSPNPETSRVILNDMVA